MNHCSVYYLQLMNCLWMDHAMKGLQLVPPGEPLILAKWAAAAAAAAGRKLPFKCSGNGGSVGGCGAPPLNSKGGGGWVAPCGPAWGISSMTTYAISFVVFNTMVGSFLKDKMLKKTTKKWCIRGHTWSKDPGRSGRGAAMVVVGGATAPRGAGGPNAAKAPKLVLWQSVFPGSPTSMISSSSSPLWTSPSSLSSKSSSSKSLPSSVVAAGKSSLMPSEGPSVPDCCCCLTTNFTLIITLFRSYGTEIYFFSLVYNWNRNGPEV